MHGSLFIDLKNNYQKCNGFYKIELWPDIDIYSYIISIFTNPKEDLKRIIEDPTNINDLLGDAKAFYTSSDYYDKTIYEYVKNQIATNNLISSCNKVIIEGSYTDIKEYIKNNPIIKKKKIIIHEQLKLDKEELQKLKTELGTWQELDIEVNLEGNAQSVSIDIYEKTIDAIDNIIKKIKQYHYSPLEALIYAYDLVRDRFYKKESKKELYTISRDLSSVLLGTKIVCLGFANIFKAIIQKLGINAMVVTLNNTNALGHARVLAYIKDEKYNIDGLYYFDPTFDRKKSNANEFLLSYKYFAKTTDQLSLLEKDNLKTKEFDLSYDNIEYIEKHLVNEEITLIELINVVKYTKLNKILRLLGKNPLNETIKKEELIDLLYDIASLADKPIEPTIFLKALYNVRKNQYYENPQKYLFDIDTLTTIMLNSTLKSQDDRLKELLFGLPSTTNKKIILKQVQEYIKENQLDISIERIKLTKLLSNIAKK